MKGLFIEVWAGLRNANKGCETPVNGVEPLLPLGLGDKGRKWTESLERTISAGEDCPAGGVDFPRASVNFQSVQRERGE